MWAAATGSSAGLSATTCHLSTPQRNLLEAHWNGTLLDAPEAVCGFTASMTWKGVHPVVALVTTTYATGVTLTKGIMAVVEAQLARLPHRDKWCVDIPYSPGGAWDASLRPRPLYAPDRLCYTCQTHEHHE